MVLPSAARRYLSTFLTCKWVEGKGVQVRGERKYGIRGVRRVKENTRGKGEEREGRGNKQSGVIRG